MYACFVGISALGNRWVEDEGENRDIGAVTVLVLHLSRSARLWGAVEVLDAVGAVLVAAPTGSIEREGQSCVTARGTVGSRNSANAGSISSRSAVRSVRLER